MKDSTALILAGLISMFLVLFSAVFNAGLFAMGGFCLIGTVLMSFGFASMCDEY